MKLLMTVGLTLALATPVAMARPGGGGMGHQKHFRQMIEQLDLTEEQKEKIQSIRSSSRDNMRTHRQELKGLRQSFHESLKSGADEATLRAAFSKLEDAKGEMAKLRFENMLEIRKVLNDEQRKKFHELKEQRRGKRKGPRFGQPEAE